MPDHLECELNFYYRSINYQSYYLQQGQTALSISQKLGYISVVEALKNVTKTAPSSTSDEKYKVISPETMQETFMSDSEDEGGNAKLFIILLKLNSNRNQWSRLCVKLAYDNGTIIK